MSLLTHSGGDRPPSYPVNDPARAAIEKSPIAVPKSSSEIDNQAQRLGHHLHRLEEVISAAFAKTGKVRRPVPASPVPQGQPQVTSSTTVGQSFEEAADKVAEAVRRIEMMIDEIDL